MLLIQLFPYLGPVQEVASKTLLLGYGSFLADRIISFWQLYNSIMKLSEKKSGDEMRHCPIHFGFGWCCLIRHLCWSIQASQRFSFTCQHNGVEQLQFIVRLLKLRYSNFTVANKLPLKITLDQVRPLFQVSGDGCQRFQWLERT